MLNSRIPGWVVAACRSIAFAFIVAVPAIATAQQNDQQALLRRIELLEKRLTELQAQGRGTPGQPQAPSAQSRTEQPGGTAQADSQAVLERLEAIEKRMADLESSAVLSEPETRVKRIEVWVDKNGNEYDQPTAGAEKTVTYQRERVYRRQTINEKIEEALASEETKSVSLGIDVASVTQGVYQTTGPDSEADGHAYELASADLIFAAKLAQNTTLFADVVGLSGSPPDSEVQGLTLLNAYTARLVRQNELNLREAWIRTELFDQKLALSLGRLDLTNYFDNNTVANDETSQFLSDALANNPLLGLSSNGAGLAAVYDPKGAYTFKVGVQQSDPDATNLSESIYSLAEIGYRARPFSLGEGNYRLWYRQDNSADVDRNAFGVSLDQRLTPTVSVFGRFGSGDADAGHDRFYSVGLQFQNNYVFNPLDVWGFGYAQLKLASDAKERLVESYYNLWLSEKLRVSFHLQYVREFQPGAPTLGYVVPGIRLQAGL